MPVLMSGNFSSRLFRAVSGLILLGVLTWSSGFSGIVTAQGQSPNAVAQEKAAAQLARLTPEERVGQLFLVAIPGAEIGPDSPIRTLISEYHIGGVVLLARNDNFIDNNDPAATVEQANQLIQQLQSIEWEASREPHENPLTGESFVPNYVPLLIGISQEGDGYPYDQILSGLTTLPNQMALGATWTPDLAQKAGAILGQELSALGVNLLLGPVLDVLDPPELETAGNLSTRTFGGDPFWVAEMGRAYIRGVHQGSNNQVAVVAKHFPGHGSSDRLPEEEVATVRKSLDALSSFDLAPFLAVTGNAASAEETTDALLTSHIRYQGLQGNIRATTRPVSLDPQALSLLFELPPLSTWRNNGGVMVSDDLGNTAIRRFYALTSQTFDPRRVALNAFLAGNDLLYFGDFSTSPEEDSATAAIRTLASFTQKYRDDAAFAQRVDESVLRILTLKNRLYPSFLLSSVLPNPRGLSDLGQASQTGFDIARKAATLLSPSQAELDTTMPDPPNQNDRIVFITDTRLARQCTGCPARPLIDKRALQDAVVRLYGPQTAGQVTLNNLSSFSLEELQLMLNGSPDAVQLELNLRRANWIVFSMLSDSPDVPSFQVLRSFLTERPDLFQQKRLIVFAFNAPYFLDATNISKLTAYFALYSKAPGFIDVAAYLLFGELRATGASPVSVPGIAYNLNEALFPDPTQTIPLIFDLPEPAQGNNGTSTPEPPPTPAFRVGDVVPLRTGVILDHNGNPVPDGTPVTFTFTTGVESNSVRQVEYTQKGIARTTFSISGPGILEIRAESEAARSDVLRLDIPAPGEGGPTLTPTEPPTLTPTIVPPTEIPTPQPTLAPEEPVQRPGLGDWIMAVLTASILALVIYRLASLIGYVRWGVRAGFMTLIGGLTAYSLLVFFMRQGERLTNSPLALEIFLATLAGSGAGLLIVLAWRLVIQATQVRQTDEGAERTPSAH
jgi:beta-N-acetylhexosaminidase